MLHRIKTQAFVLVASTCTLLGAAGQVFPGKAWKEVQPESQGVNSATLKAAVVYMEAFFGPEGAKELAIVRNGYLIHRGPNVDSYHNIWSATKTFTSTVLGLLVADGKCTTDDLAVKHLPSLGGRYPAYAKVKLRHLASMSAGYKGEVAGKSKEQPWGDPTFYLNPVAPLFDAGINVDYNDHEVFLLGSILTRLARESEKAFFNRRIAGPIGMTRWDWGVSGKLDGVNLNNAAGTPETPGIQTTARELARYGLLYLNRGNWNGKQLLPAGFVDDATRNQVPGAGRSAFLHTRYGFYWWTNDVRPDGKRPWPAAPPGTYAAHGRSANFCFVIPEWKMVVVRMGTIPIARVPREEPLWDAFLAKLADALSGGERKERP